MKVILFANTDWYLYHYRLPLAQALRDSGCQVVLMSPDGDYHRYLAENGFRWINFPLSRRGKNPLNELSTILRIYRVYRSEKPDGVQHFTIKCVIYGSLAARLTQVKTIVNAIPGLGHVFIDTRWQGKLLRRLVVNLYRFSLKRTRVIFQNPDDQHLFLREKIVTTEQQVLIKGSGIDLERFPILPEPPVPPVIILPARMLWAKGIQEFIDAAKLLKKNGVDARFVLVGDSDPNTAGSVPRSQLQAWHDEGAVEWWGWKEDMLEVLREAHLICLPSYYGEGVPRSLVEAASCGRPVIAADIPGSREIVHHGENGYLVKPRDSEALAESIRLFVENPALRIKMGKRGREIAAAEFSLASTIKRNMELFDIPS